jgi:acyl-CoA reductase-like NAD-dependent aldehyde dehydrogenase
MQDHHSNTRSRDNPHNFETRVAIDVMFEALSHIQASIDATTEEERVQSYRKFKEALYERYDHLLEQRRQEQEATTLEEKGKTNGHAPDRLASGSETAEDDDTLGRLWPAISDNTQSPDV